MKRYFSLFIIPVVMGIFFISCNIVTDSGYQMDEDRIIASEYSGISVESGIIVEFSNDMPSDNVEVSGDSNILPYVQTYVNSSGVLVIKYKNRVNIRSKIWTTVTIPEIINLKSVSASGGARVRGHYEINSSNLKIDGSGGANIALEGIFKTLDIEGSGGAKINIVGDAEKCIIDLSGGSNVRNFNLDTEILNCSLSGGSDVEITCTEEMKIHASGGSKLHYKGDCQIIDIKLSGGSKVVKR